MNNNPSTLQFDQKSKDQQNSSHVFIKEKSRFRSFAFGTTMHGFKELYMTEKWLIRGAWLVAITLCCSFLIYQTYEMTIDFANGRKTTSIYPLTKGGYPLPSVSIGVSEWHWINYSKVQNMGMTPEMLVVAKSFLNYDVSWPKQFDVNETKRNLFLLLKRRNVTNLPLLIKAMAYQNPLGLSRVGFSELLYKGDDVTKKIICELDKCIYYLQSEAAVKSSAISVKAEYAIGHLAIHLELAKTYEKYKKYFLQNTDNNTEVQQNNNQLQYIPSLHISNSWDPLPINQGQDYIISYNVRLYKYMSTNERPCRPSTDQDDPYEQIPFGTCKQDCEIQAIITLGTVTCYPLDFGNSDANPWPLCSTGVSFENDYENRYGFETSPIDSWNSWISSSDDKRKKSIIDKCVERRCVPTCDRYAADTNILAPPRSDDVVNRSKTSSIITLRFPANDTVIISEEIEAFIWLTYISNLGGILGLWLGASMMSFCQIFYLCAFPNYHRIEQH